MSSAVKETYDSNVYLQSQTELANRPSFVTTWIGQATAAWASTPWNVRLGYQPEAHFFHAQPTEDHFDHRASADLRYATGNTAVDLGGTAVLIDGASEGPTWTGPGGAPATGGPAVRDRRDAAVYRGCLRATESLGDWLLRPTATGYEHDFRTETKTTPGYQNYVDRKEATVGTDVGRRLDKEVSVGLAYRYGVQDESPLLGFPEEYDNHFHRLLAWIDGRLAPWLRVNLWIGPEMRRYENGVPAAFGDRDESNLYVDATVTVTPGPSDTLVVSAKQFEQPGFGGRSAYEDLTLDASWRHRLNARWTIGVGGRAYNTDFLAPVVRNDWVASVYGMLHCAVTRALSAEGSYQFEDGWTGDPRASAREYTRHLAVLGLRYVFR